ncbi:MAG: holo-ACP synthase [Acidimicrobiia bacterium]
MIGLGIDNVDIERFRRVLERTPGFAGRVFTDAELAYANEARDPTQRLAARFAAKEAVMKVLGVGIGEVRLRDIEVVRADSGAPSLRLHGSAAELAEGRSVRRWLLSLTHTDLVASAVAVAE